MSAPIDLAAARQRRAENGPDPDCIVTDPQGREMMLYLVTWTWGGREYGVHIPAYDGQHAQEQVFAMRASLSLGGQLVAQGELPWWRGFEKENERKPK